MTQYDNTDRGALFKNDRKQQENHPDYKGSINIGGTEYWLSGWKKETAKGPMLSLSVKPKEAPAQQKQQGRSQQKQDAGSFEDDIPW